MITMMMNSVVQSLAIAIEIQEIVTIKQLNKFKNVFQLTPKEDC
jgi:hypothetical protein